MNFIRSFCVVFGLVFLGLGCKPSGSAELADVIYVGGNIVTMNDAQPDADALAVKDGKVLALGSRADIEKAHMGEATAVVDLAGKTLMPGFIDGHAHGLQFGTQAIGANMLAPPDGTVNSIDDVVAMLIAFQDSSDAKLSGWIFGTGYDDSLLGRHSPHADGAGTKGLGRQGRISKARPEDGEELWLHHHQ